MKVAAVSSVTILGVVIIGSAVELLWINPLERSAARTALADIEGLQQVSNTSEDSYRRRKEYAEAAVERTQQDAWTLRDKHISDALEGYLLLTDVQHDEPRRLAALNAFYQAHPERRSSPLPQPNDLSPQVIEFLRKTLHSALD